MLGTGVMASAPVSASRESRIHEGYVRYVYGVIEAANFEAPRAPSGLDDKALEQVRFAELAAVVSGLLDKRALGNRDDLLAYHRVLDYFADRGPIVPLRFGSLVSTDGAVVDHLLSPQAERFRRMLRYFDGRAQLNLRARYRGDVMLAEIVGQHPDIAWLRTEARSTPELASVRARRRLGARIAQVLDDKRDVDSGIIIDSLSPHAVAYTRRRTKGVDHLLDIAFLIDRSRRDYFHDASKELAKLMDERVMMRLAGPVAPYDFVSTG
jgi:hypothetical protein